MKDHLVIQPTSDQKRLWLAEAIHELGDRAPLIEIAARVADKAYKAGIDRLGAQACEVATFSPVKTALSFEFAYSKLVRHISFARCRLDDDGNPYKATRDQWLREQICEAYEFIKSFEKMMTTPLFTTNEGTK